MRQLIALPIILIAVVLQSAVVSRVSLLSGIADLPLVMLAAWALQEDVETAWHWAIATGLMVGFVSAVPLAIPMVGYLLVVALAQVLQQRVWQAPLLAVFLITFLGTLGINGMTIITLQLTGIPIAFRDALGLVVLPSMLLNLLLAIPVYAVIRDLARWVYPLSEIV